MTKKDKLKEYTASEEFIAFFNKEKAKIDAGVAITRKLDKILESMSEMKPQEDGSIIMSFDKTEESEEMKKIYGEKKIAKMLGRRIMNIVKRDLI